MKTLLACFSATGNTATIVRVLQKRLEDLGAGIDLLDITTPEGRDHAPGMAEYRAAVFGAPIHSMRARPGSSGTGWPC
jgi:menaquinone-dependent protoporphyrinogen IX oxidase